MELRKLPLGTFMSLLIVFFTNLMYKFFILIHLLHSCTCFELYCAHLQEDNCINTASGIVTLETSGWSKLLKYILLLCLYHAHNKITQLSIPAHAQLQHHRLKFIKNHLKAPTCFGLRPSSGSYNVLTKVTII